MNIDFLFVGSILNPQTLFHDAASNIIYLVLSGTRYEYGDETLKKYITLITENIKIFNGPWSMVRHYIITLSLTALGLLLILSINLKKYLKELMSLITKEHEQKNLSFSCRSIILFHW